MKPFIYMAMVFSMLFLGRGISGAQDRLQDEFGHEFARQVISLSPWEGSDIEVSEIEFSGNENLANGFDAIKVNAPKGVRTLGKITVPVSLMSKGAEIKTIWASARIRLYRNAVIAVNSIKKGSSVSEKDLTLKRIEVRDSSDLPRTIADVSGMAAKRPIPAGAVVKMDYLVAQTIVKRGDVVAIHMENERIKIKAKGIATEDGSNGSIISARSVAGKELRARVIGPGELTVDF